MINVTGLNIEFKSNMKRVLPLFLRLPKPERNSRIISEIESLPEDEVQRRLKKVIEKFNTRHLFLENEFIKNYSKLQKISPSSKPISKSKKLLIGAYFTKEYSIESAALFNPSIVEHPNQYDCKDDELRFIVSFRATGEGHISSIVFNSGKIDSAGTITMESGDNLVTVGEIDEQKKYSKEFILKRLPYYGVIDDKLANVFPDEFTKAEILAITLNAIKKSLIKGKNIMAALEDIFETNYEIHFDPKIPLTSRVLFPQSKAEAMGMEDARFVKFIDGKDIRYIGTYTAYDGRKIRSQLIQTTDFCSFKIRRLYGKAIQDKGMALFPEKIGNKYVIAGRQGGEANTIMYSENLYFWDSFKVIQSPQRNWELVQLGNCGSPIKTKVGWFLLTHAVGPMREYVISATLLDLDNPGKVISSLNEPLLSPMENERDGYVPNVVYTCGILKHGDNLIIPYAMSDSATRFAIANFESILETLTKPRKT